MQRSQWNCDATAPLALKFARSVASEPPPPAPRSGDDDVRPMPEPSPALEAEGAAGEGASEANPPRGGLAACEEELRSQETTYFVHLMNSLNCFKLLEHIIQAEFSLTPAAFCIS